MSEENLTQIQEEWNKCWKKAAVRTTLENLVLAVGTAMLGATLHKYTSLEGAAYVNYGLSALCTYAALYSYSLKDKGR